MTEAEKQEMFAYMMSHAFVYGRAERVHFGEGVQTNNTVFNTSSGEIIVGNGTIFGHGVMVLTGRHEFENGHLKKSRDMPPNGFDIHIGSGCWIGSGAIISGGVTIGDNVKIGAGAVVTKDIPSGTFAVGVPAEVKGAA